MRGRSWPCLLVLSSLIVAPAAVKSQSRADLDQPDFGHDLAALYDRIPLPAPDPVGHGPTFPRIWPRPVHPGTFGFPQLARSSGIIFSGTVASIARHPATRGQAVATVTVRFHVENAIRGTSAGANLTVSQWIAVWSAGQRYRVGEHLLLFLYPPSKLGLTSCVAGPLGRFALDPEGRVTLTAQHLSAFRTDPVLGGKSRVSLSDFALAVRQATEEE
ncbi:MAG TPA: hypothetical protein VKA07_01300 [Candidatus Sulfotelmatobacter sp.]|nr:hypothetical protein [Candidatus Sulfotelmatobacter sp.]